jgi:hypothetical protein
MATSPSGRRFWPMAMPPFNVTTRGRAAFIHRCTTLNHISYPAGHGCVTIMKSEICSHPAFIDLVCCVLFKKLQCERKKCRYD